MGIDLRQVMAAFLTASMFVMLANMIKKDHIDPLFEEAVSSPNVQYDVMKLSKRSHVQILDASATLWKQDHPAPNLCFKNPSPPRQTTSKGFIFFSLSSGPEYHPYQVANAVHIAKYLGATLVLPDFRTNKVGVTRNFGEVYDVNKFISSLDGVVQVAKSRPAEVPEGKISTVRVLNKVSERFIALKVQPLFNTGRSLRIVTYFPASAKEKKRKNADPYECLAMFQALDLQPELKQLADSMVGTLRSLSQKTSGQFIAVDLRKDKNCHGNSNSAAGSKSCYNAAEIGQFLKKIGVHRDTTIYLTQSGWDKNLNALRDIFPYTFTKDAIMPMDGKARFMNSDSSEVQNVIDLHICKESDVFVPAQSSRLYENVAAKRIASGKTHIIIPAQKASASAVDYISPYITKKSHQAYSCVC